VAYEGQFKFDAAGRQQPRGPGGGSPSVLIPQSDTAMMVRACGPIATAACSGTLRAGEKITGCRAAGGWRRALPRLPFQDVVPVEEHSSKR